MIEFTPGNLLRKTRFKSVGKLTQSPTRKWRCSVMQHPGNRKIVAGPLAIAVLCLLVDGIRNGPRVAQAQDPAAQRCPGELRARLGAAACGPGKRLPAGSDEHAGGGWIAFADRRRRPGRGRVWRRQRGPFDAKQWAAVRSPGTGSSPAVSSWLVWATTSSTWATGIRPSACNSTIYMCSRPPTPSCAWVWTPDGKLR